MKRFCWLALILLLLTACAPAAETAVSTQPTPASETTILPTNTVPPPVVEEVVQAEVATAVPDLIVPTEAPTTAPPNPTAEIVAEASVVSGRTEEGAFFLGDPNAPITHIDYSDFL